jgi:hypothetical protein
VIFSPVIFQLRTMTIVLTFSAIANVSEFPERKQESTTSQFSTEPGRVPQFQWFLLELFYFIFCDKKASGPSLP